MQSTTNTYQQASNQEKRDRLILGHMDYVRQICGTLAKRFPDGVDLNNLQSAGVVGLIEAAQNFDPSRGVAFKTFAYPRIRGAIVDEIRRNSPLSQRIMRSIGRIRAIIEVIEPPFVFEDIARQANMSVSDVEEAFEAMRIASPVRWDDSYSAAHQAAATSPPEFAIETEERQRILADGIEHLPERERTVLTLYYHEELKLKEIGQVLNLSESRVSRILASAEIRLRQYCNSQGVE